MTSVLTDDSVSLNVYGYKLEMLYPAKARMFSTEVGTMVIVVFKQGSKVIN